MSDRTAKWTDFFKLVTPKPDTSTVYDNQDLGAGGAYNNFTWYQRCIQGSASRLTRYREYEGMDLDVDVNRALDTIAEEIIGSASELNDNVLKIIMANDGEENINQDSITVMTLDVALNRWISVHGFDTKLFYIARNVCKFGDCFFKREHVTSKWEYIPAKNVLAAIVDSNDVTKIVAWQIRKDTKQVSTANTYTPVNTQDDKAVESEIISADQIVRFTLNDEMSESAPFGDSILKPVYRSFKQKELLEDAIIIYRIQRAPERRVFYIDVGKMPPARIKQYLEGIKNEIKQKKVPNFNGGTDQVDTIYNPHSMQEDYFFASREGSRGSKVETLPGGCLSLDTKIPLLDGRTLALHELIDEFNDGKQNWVYSCDPITGEFVPGKIDWAGITHESSDVYELELDNGEKLILTNTHSFPIWGKGKTKISDMEIGDSIISFNLKDQPLKESYSTPYMSILNHTTKKYEFVHRKVHQFMKSSGVERYSIFNGDLANEETQVIHHNDFDRYNNSPENLITMGHKDHYLYHSKIDTRTQKWIEKFNMDEQFRKESMDRIILAGQAHQNLLKTDPIYRQNFCDSIKSSLSEYYANLTDEEREIKKKIAKDNFMKGTLKFQEKLKTDQIFAQNMRKKVSDSLKLKFATDIEYKNKKVSILLQHAKRLENQEIIISDDMIAIVKFLFESGYTLRKDMFKKLKSTYEFMTIWNGFNQPVDGKICNISQEFKIQHLDKIIQYMGYESWDDFKYSRLRNIKFDETKLSSNRYTKNEVSLIKFFVDEIIPNHKNLYSLEKSCKNTILEKRFIELCNICNFERVSSFGRKTVNRILSKLGFDDYESFVQYCPMFNHRVKSIKKLDYTLPVGTITVDKNEIFHDYHTFALDCGVYTFNSGLGQLDDLTYFEDKVTRGLRIPVSYMKQGQENAMFNDGKVGMAYIQELRFSLFIQRLQNHIEVVLDEEFKNYLNACNIMIDASMFKVKLPEPSNFGKYKEQELDTALLSTYQQADGIAHMSKRFALKKYLQWDQADILMNERMLREEKGLNPDSNDPKELPMLYGQAGDGGMGGMGGMGGAPGLGGGMGGSPMDMAPEGGDIGGDMGGMPPEGGAGGTPDMGGAEPPPTGATPPPA